MIWIETPTNPTLKLVDIRSITTYIHQLNSNIIVVVDNTFLSPYFQVASEFLFLIFRVNSFHLFVDSSYFRCRYCRSFSNKVFKWS
jgi:histidinol-phosphate/aromatic aminotransferase/cobyric acid decarboxylase-like protein